MPRRLTNRYRWTSAIVVIITAFCLSIGMSTDTQAASAPPLRGVAIDVLYGETDNDTIQQLDLAKRLNANTVRLSISWAGLEPYNKGEYAQWYLHRLDVAVAEARKRRIQVILTPVFSPCWASAAPAEVKNGCPIGGGGPATESYGPHNPADYADFVTMLVNRYHYNMRALEVWNEPNLASFLRDPQPAQAYVKILKAASVASRQAQPSVKVLAGALSGSDVVFLRALYAGGIRGYYDGLSIHPYNGDRAPETLLPKRFVSGSFIQGVPAIHQLQLRHRDTTQLWLTEFGYQTSTVRKQNQFVNGISANAQARWLARSIAIVGKLPYVRAATIYQLRDVTADKNNPQSNYGLVTRDYQLKQSFSAVKQAFTRKIKVTKTR